MSAGRAQRGRAKGRGSALVPRDLPPDTRGERNAATEPVPIGRPVTAEEFAKMKREAARKRGGRRVPAQEDPAEDDPDRR